MVTATMDNTTLLGVAVIAVVHIAVVMLLAVWVWSF
jgi:hypothetical protein